MGPSPPGNVELFELIDRQLNEFVGQGHFDRQTFFGGASIREADIRTLIMERMQEFRAALDETPQDMTGFPKIVHRLWITSLTHGVMPPIEYLGQIAAQSKEIGPEYLYAFWCNSGEICDQVRAFFAEAGAVISVSNFIISFYNDKLIPVIQKFIAVRKYVLAADVAKIVLLERIGGAYADLGVQFGRGLLQLLERADAALFLDSGMFFQPAFIALRPNSAIAGLWSAVLTAPEILSAMVLADVEEFSAGHEVWLHGGVGFTVIFVLFQPLHYRVLILPPQGAALQTHSQGSWYQEGNKFGNVILRDAPVTHLDMEKHRRRIEVINGTLEAAPLVSAPETARFKITSCLPDNHVAPEDYWLR